MGWFRVRALACASCFGFILLALDAATASASAAPVSVTCTTQNPTALSSALTTALGTAKIGTPIVFNVTGTCTDSISIPQGAIVTINGSGTGTYGATLNGGSTTNPAIHVLGQLTVNKMKIQSAQTTESVVRAAIGGWLGLFNSSVSSTTTTNTVTAWSNSDLTIENSVVSGGNSSAVNLNGSGHVWIDATNGNSTTISYTGTQGGQAIGCWGGSFEMGTYGTGTVTIGPSTAQGISMRGCTTQIGISSMTKNAIKITQATDAAIRAKSGDAIVLVNAEVDSAPNAAIEVSAGSVEFQNSTIVVATDHQGLVAKRGGVMYFGHINNTTSSVTVSGGANAYSCYQGGAIYADSGYAPTGGAATSGCLTIGGSVTH